MNLISLTAVKQWLNISSASDDAILNRQIAQASSFVLNFLQRPTLPNARYTEYHSGKGTSAITLRRWPVNSVASVTIDGQAIPQAVDPTDFGWSIEEQSPSLAGKPQQLFVNGSDGQGGMIRAFSRGANNIIVIYEAGYQTLEVATINQEDYTAQPSAALGPWAQDDGVAYVSGAALAKVSGAPSLGQYSLSVDVDSGVPTYQFAAADKDAAITLTYSFIPADVSDAAMNIVGERFRYRDRIGKNSQSSAGQVTTSFSNNPMPQYTKDALMPYRLAFPL